MSANKIPLSWGAIGSPRSPGLFKILEEAGEVLQVIGKIGGALQPDDSAGAPITGYLGGNLQWALANELADLDAAAAFALEHWPHPEYDERTIVPMPPVTFYHSAVPGVAWLTFYVLRAVQLVTDALTHGRPADHYEAQCGIIGDLQRAIAQFTQLNSIDAESFNARRDGKLAAFRTWHAEGLAAAAARGGA